jgi:hypothetical protein
VKMNLYLLPGSNKNLEISINRTVSNTQLERHLAGPILNRIIQRLGGQNIHCWAFGLGTRSNYDMMRENDIVLFKQNSTEAFSIKGRVADKVISAALGNSLWPICDEEPWEFIFFVKDIANVSIRFSRLCTALGYANNFTWLPGAKRVADARLTQAIRKFGSIEKFIAHLEGGAQAEPPKKEITTIRRPGTGTQRLQPTQPIIHFPPEGSTKSSDEEDTWKI